MGLTNNLGKLSNMITSTGTAVGIGTTTPAELVEVSAPAVAGTSQQARLRITQAGSISARANLVSGVISGENPYFAIETRQSASPFSIVERLRIDGNGNVGIANSNPLPWGGGFLGLSVGQASVGCLPTTANSYFTNNIYYDGAFRRGVAAASSIISMNEDVITFANSAAGTAGGTITFNERMRITGGGNVLINTTTSNNTPLEIECGSGGDGIYLKRSGAYSQMFIGGNTTGTAITFIRTAGSGGVRLDSGATAWASSSDERLKNINGSIENALDSLLTLRAVNFSWKSDETNKNNLGLIAQDIVKVFPETVTLDEENDVLGVRYTELIPVLVKAIQELSAKVSALENKS